VIVLCWFGTISLMLALMPSVAILPILLYIGMLIGSQAFQETPRRHAPAVVLALVPHLAAWALALINGALTAAGSAVPTLTAPQLAALVGRMRNEGVLYDGLHVLGGGSILSGLVLGAIGVFVIERDFKKASAFALAGAAMTFFGFMHGERIGIGESPAVALSYLAVAAIFAGCAHFVTVAVARPSDVLAESHGEELAV
jgi:adenine/guanine/hypoxanthine permease